MEALFREGEAVLEAKIKVDEFITNGIGQFFQQSITENDSVLEEVILGDYAKYLPEEILDELTDEQWDVVSGSKRMNDIDIDENIPFSDYFIDKHADKLHWDTLCACYHSLSENILRENSERLDWSLISLRELSNEFTEEFAHRLDWNQISQREGLSEDFIEMFQNRVNWSLISEHQELSEEFILRYSYLIDFRKLLESEYAPSTYFIAKMLTLAYRD